MFYREVQVAMEEIRLKARNLDVDAQLACFGFGKYYYYEGFAVAKLTNLKNCESVMS